MIVLKKKTKHQSDHTMTIGNSVYKNETYLDIITVFTWMHENYTTCVIKMHELACTQDVITVTK